MAKKDGTQATDVTTDQTAEPTVVINGEEVPVSQAADKYKEMETSLHGDYTQKTQDVAAREKTVNDRDVRFNADLDWYNTHSAEEVGNYDPTCMQKADGSYGKGETEGAVQPVTPATNPTNPSPKAFAEDPEVRVLKDRINTLEGRVQDSGVRDVKEATVGLLKQYPNANQKNVLNALDVFWNTNQVHPTTAQIEAIVKEQHNFVQSKIQAANKPVPGEGAPTEVTTAMPDAGGGTPVATAPETFNLEDNPEGFLKSIKSKVLNATSLTHRRLE